MPPTRPEELLLALLRSASRTAGHGPVVRRRPTTALKLPGARRLSYLATSRSRPVPATQLLRVSAAAPARGLASASQTVRKPADKPAREQIAVLGGGITGLTAAHYLARHAPDAHITLYEASDRLGGWVDGRPTPVDQNGGGEVLMQRGPRMLRSGASTTKYDDLVLYDVLANLGIPEKLIYCDTTGPAGTRYIYYPDHLVKLPDQDRSLANILRTIYSFFTEPLWEGAFLAGWRTNRFFLANQSKRLQMARDSKNQVTVYGQDESVSAFWGRIMGDSNAGPIRNIISAMFHGIYGGDVDKISVRHSMFETVWHNSVYPPSDRHQWVAFKELCLKNDIVDGPNGIQVVEMAEKARDYGLLMFEDGLVTLADGLVADLKAQPNVTIKTETAVSALEHKDNKVEVSSSGGQSQKFDKVLSTLYSRQLAQLAKPANSLPSLAETQAVSIYVVNLWYPNTELKQEQGFGYLIPQSVPPEENPECALGVIFDSDIQQTKEVPGTKLTVMMGGHYWDSWPILPSEEMAGAMAKAVVERHLGIPAEEDVVVGAKLCRDCIPQHTVGHFDRMRQAHYELLDTFKGQLTVAGPSYTTVGILPAMRAGFDAALRIARGHGSPWHLRDGGKVGAWKFYEFLREQPDKDDALDHVGTTGLKWAADAAGRMSQVRMDSMWFKKWANENHRFLDSEGNWKYQEMKEEMSKNSEKV